MRHFKHSTQQAARGVAVSSVGSCRPVLGVHMHCQIPSPGPDLQCNFELPEVPFTVLQFTACAAHIAGKSLQMRCTMRPLLAFTALLRC